MTARLGIWLIMIAAITLLFGALYVVLTTEPPQAAEDPAPEVIGGERDQYGCLTPAGYSFDAEVGACTRVWELTPDIREAAKKAVQYAGGGEGMTVVSFNAYEEVGAYDIMLERGEARDRVTVSLRGEAWSLLECRESDRYFVVERSRSAEGTPGSDILVKTKGEAGQSFACVYEKSEGDVEITDEGPAYLLDIADGFLLLDHGTAPPPRGLSVYDIAEKEVVYEDRYNRPVARGDDAFTYWQPIDTKPTAENCPDLATWTAQGLGAGIEREVTLTLSTRTVTPSGAERCSARQ